MGVPLHLCCLALLLVLCDQSTFAFQIIPKATYYEPRNLNQHYAASETLDELVEKFAEPLEFKKSGDAGDAVSSEVESSPSSTATAPASTEKEVAPSKDVPSDATAEKFTQSTDTPLANKYYQK